MSRRLLILAIVSFLAGSGCTTPAAHRALQRNLQAPDSTTKMLAVYMPWFGDHVHIDVGYSSNDPVVIRQQIQQAQHSGISAFVVDWYGPTLPFSDHEAAAAALSSRVA